MKDRLGIRISGLANRGCFAIEPSDTVLQDHCVSWGRELVAARSSNSAYALFVWKPQTRWRREGNSERAVPAVRKGCPVEATVLGLGAGAELWIASDPRFRRCANYIQIFFGEGGAKKRPLSSFS
jgi:hypothetical protein